jgi:hypothetical protein
MFQTLDLCLFGVFEMKIQSRLLFLNDSLTVNFIQNAFHATKQPFARSAFRMLGLEFKVTQVPYTLLFGEEKLRQSQGFGEIREADYRLDQLCKRRREV